jgi:serine O-acetyltransferase
METFISASVPDFSREEPRRLWDPPRRLLKSLRRYQASRERSGLLAAGIRYASVLEHRFWSAVTGADIPLNCRLGGGLLLPHASGIVIHPDATIGPNCLIFQQVTLTEGVRIGGHVDIGAGAKIVGPVSIGDHANVGANAVVLDDVPEGATAVGVPARVILPGSAHQSARHDCSVEKSRRVTEEAGWKTTDAQRGRDDEKAGPTKSLLRR